MDTPSIDVFNKLLSENRMMLVDFYADWCEPCKMLDVILEELQSQFDENLFILKIDVDASVELSKSFSVMSVPVLALFKDGVLVWRMNGFMMTNELTQKICEFT